MAKGIKTGGRQKGTPNRKTRELREIVQNLIDRHADDVAVWFKQVGEDDPARAITLLTGLAEFAAPKLQRTEVSGPAGGPLQVVINRLV